MTELPQTPTHQAPDPNNADLVDGTAPVKPARKVYESQLELRRNRRRTPKWIFVALFAAVSTVLYYLIVVAPHVRRHVNTAGKLVFIAEDRNTGHSHIWISNIDGSNPKQLTKGDSSEESPTFSADGNQIAFSSNREGGIYQLFVMDADGKNLVQITKNAVPKLFPRFDPVDSTELFYIADGGLNVVNTFTFESDRLLPQTANGPHTDVDQGMSGNDHMLIKSYDLSHTANSKITSVAAVEDFNGINRLVLLPDINGKSIESQSDIAQTPVGGAPSSPIVASDAMTVRWKPDGRSVAVSMIGINGMGGDKGLSAIALFTTDGHIVPPGPFFVVRDKSEGLQNSAFFPDGSRIVAEVWSKADTDQPDRIGIATLPVTGGVPTMMLPSPGESPTVDRAGDKVFVLVFNKKGIRSLVSLDLKNHDVNAVTNSPGDITEYSLSPQGQS